MTIFNSSGATAGDPGRSGHAVVEGHAFAKGAKGGSTRLTFDMGEVLLVDPEGWVGEPVSE